MIVIDCGEEQNLIWVVALDDSGEIWCSPNPIMRLRSNLKMGRKTAKYAPSDGGCSGQTGAEETGVIV